MRKGHTANGGDAEITAPEPIMLGLAVACMAGIAVVPVVTPDGSPSSPAIAAFGIASLACFLLSVIPRDPVIRPLLMIVAAACTIPIGYVVGPSSVLGAVLAMVVLLIGMHTPGTQTRWLGWGLAGLIAIGQLALGLLVVSGALDDRSLVPTLVDERPVWHVLLGHLALQALFATAFFTGRALRLRYRQIVEDTVVATDRARLRNELLADARDGRARVRSTSDAEHSDASASEETTRRIRPRTAAGTGRARAVTEIEEATVDRWFDSFQRNMVHHDLLIGAAAIAGFVVVIAIVPAPARWIGATCLLVIGAMVVARRWLMQRRSPLAGRGPLVVIALASAGPAYAIGLHTGSVAPLVILLVVGRLFRAPNGAVARADDIPFVAIAGASHLACFLAVMAGALPDAGLFPIVQPGTGAFAAFVVHGSVLAILALAHLLGRHLDGKLSAHYEAARLRAMAEQRRDDDARSDVGLFSDTEIGGYRVGPLLGRGGMGEVYRAEGLFGPVALKLMQIRHMDDPAIHARFEREASMLLRINSPHCARVLDVNASVDLPYVVLEYVEGTSLAEILRERELDPGEIAGLISDLTRGLDDIHAAGVIHLDIKPGNVILGHTPHGRRWKIVDFGLAQSQSGDRIAGSTAGTPTYMAPERVAGFWVDTRADIYSAALVCLRVIAGGPVFRSRCRTGEPIDPIAISSLDENVALALRIALAPDPRERFATATELRDALLGALTGRFDERVRRRGRTASNLGLSIAA